MADGRGRAGVRGASIASSATRLLVALGRGGRTGVEGATPRRWSPVRPLSLAGLRRREQVLLAAGLVMLGLASTVLVAAAVGLQPSAGSSGWGWMGAGGWATAATRVGAVAGFSLSAVLGVAAALRVDRAWRRIPIAAAALLLFRLASASLNYANLVAWPDQPAWWARALRFAGIAAAAVLPFLPLATARQRWSVLAVATVPGFVAVILLVATGGATAPWIANVDARNDPIWTIYQALQAMLVVSLLWGLLDWSRLVTSWSESVTRVATRATSVVVVFVGVKLVWITAGLAGVLPAGLGGQSDVWDRSRHDGVGSWVTASALALLVGVWLVRRSRTRRTAPAGSPDGSGVPPRGFAVLLGVALVVCAPAVAAGAIWLLPTFTTRGTDLVIGVAAASALGASAWVWGVRLGRSRWVAPVAALAAFVVVVMVLARTLWSPTLSTDLLPNRVLAHFFLVPLALFLAAAVVLVRTVRNGDDGEAALVTTRVAVVVFAGFAAVAVFHAAPQLQHLPLGVDMSQVGATGDFIRVPAVADEMFPIGRPAWERWWAGAAGTFEPQTLDAALTVVVVGLLLAGRRLGAAREPAVFVLVVATIFAHSGTLAPAGWVGCHWFYLAFVFPVVISFVVDAEALNDASGDRFRRVAAALAVALFLTTLVTWRYLANLLSPASPPSAVFDQFTRGLDHNLFLVVILAAWAGNVLAARWE